MIQADASTLNGNFGRATNIALRDQTVDEWLRKPPTTSELWQYALMYRALGWNVIPLKGKKPVVAWKSFQKSRPSLFQLEKLCRRKGVTGLAVITGWISGHKSEPGTPARKLCVRDFDTRESFERWALLHPDLAATLPRVQTKRGYHVYCWSPAELFEKLPDGELKASSDHIVVLPPSLHPDGPVYRWEVSLPTLPSAIPVICPRESGLCTKALVQHKSVTQAILSQERGEKPGGDSESLDERTEGELSNGELEEVLKCLPDGPGQREQKLFELARRLKGMPHIADADAESLKCVVRDWWRRSLPVIRTQAWETTWTAFGRSWDRAKYAIDVPAFHAKLRTAAYGPEPPEADQYTKSEVRRLVAVSADLQSSASAVGMDRFYLSCRTAAAACGFEGKHGYRSAARWLKRLVADGVLELVEAGVGGTASRLASQYRYTHLVSVGLTRP